METRYTITASNNAVTVTNETSDAVAEECAQDWQALTVGDSGTVSISRDGREWTIEVA